MSFPAKRRGSSRAARHRARMRTLPVSLVIVIYSRWCLRTAERMGRGSEEWSFSARDVMRDVVDTSLLVAHADPRGPAKLRTQEHNASANRISIYSSLHTHVILSEGHVERYFVKRGSTVERSCLFPRTSAEKV